MGFVPYSAFFGQQPVVQTPSAQRSEAGSVAPTASLAQGAKPWGYPSGVPFAQVVKREPPTGAQQAAGTAAQGAQQISAGAQSAVNPY